MRYTSESLSWEVHPGDRGRPGRVVFAEHRQKQAELRPPQPWRPRWLPALCTGSASASGLQEGPKASGEALSWAAVWTVWKPCAQRPLCLAQAPGSAEVPRPSVNPGREQDSYPTPPQILTSGHATAAWAS